MVEVIKMSTAATQQQVNGKQVGESGNGKPVLRCIIVNELHFSASMLGDSKKK